MHVSTTELIGYIGSAVLLISFLMPKINTLRVVNTVGCAIFVIYGILLSFKWPIIITNAAIILINIYYLRKGKKS